MIRSEQTLVLRPPSLSGDKKQFVGAVMPSTDFSEIDLTGYDFRFANLRGCSFLGSNLQGADFYGADLRDCEFDVVPFYVASSQLCILNSRQLGQKTFTVQVVKVVNYSATIKVTAENAEKAKEKASEIAWDDDGNFDVDDQSVNAWSVKECNAA